jgi:hypothetical protein
VPVGDHGGVVLVGGIGAEHAPHLRAHLFGERLQRALRHQHVVRRDAGLPGIEQLAVGDALGRLLEIGGGIDDRRRLAAELERDGREIASRGLRDQPPDPGRPGEHEVIERQARKGFCDLVLDAGHEQFGGIEFLRDRLPQQRGKVRRELARLDDDQVAGGDGADRGRERQLQRIIPGRDDADDAERLRHQPIARGQELQRSRHALRRHPAFQMFCRVPDLGEHHHRLGDIGFDRRAVAEIGRDSLPEALFIVGDDSA